MGVVKQAIFFNSFVTYSTYLMFVKRFAREMPFDAEFIFLQRMGPWVGANLFERSKFIFAFYSEKIQAQMSRIPVSVPFSVMESSW